MNAHQGFLNVNKKEVGMGVEVYRLIPNKDKYYYTTTYTSKESKIGSYPKYYSTNELKFVGKFIEHKQCGYGDGASHWDIFELHGKPIRVDYTYEGTTCFVELDERETRLYKIYQSIEIVKFITSLRMPKFYFGLS